MLSGACGVRTKESSCSAVQAFKLSISGWAFFMRLNSGGRIWTETARKEGDLNKSKRRGVNLMYAVVKRFEGDFAVCEINSQQIVSIERIYLPREARQGSPFVLGSKMVGVIEEILKRSSCESSDNE